MKRVPLYDISTKKQESRKETEDSELSQVWFFTWHRKGYQESRWIHKTLRLLTKSGWATWDKVKGKFLAVEVPICLQNLSAKAG